MKKLVAKLVSGGTKQHSALIGQFQGLSQLSLVERQGTGRQPSPGHTETNNHAQSRSLAPRDNLDSPINPTCMFLDNGRKP